MVNVEMVNNEAGEIMVIYSNMKFTFIHHRWDSKPGKRAGGTPRPNGNATVSYMLGEISEILDIFHGHHPEIMWKKLCLVFLRVLFFSPFFGHTNGKHTGF